MKKKLSPLKRNDRSSNRIPLRKEFQITKRTFSMQNQINLSELGKSAIDAQNRICLPTVETIMLNDKSDGDIAIVGTWRNLELCYCVSY